MSESVPHTAFKWEEARKVFGVLGSTGSAFYSSDLSGGLYVSFPAQTVCSKWIFKKRFSHTP